MAIPFQSSRTLTLSLKVVLISAGVLCAAIMLKISVPVVMEFAFSEIPSIWSFVASWLRPPYLYVVINCIIITIVASSKLQQKFDESPPETVVRPVPIKVSADYAVEYDSVVLKNASVDVRPDFAYCYDANIAKGSDFDVYKQVDAGDPKMESKTTTLAVYAAKEMSSGEDELAMSKSLWTPQLNSTEYSFSPYEKPSVSMRIGHRKVVKSSPEGGRALGVSKPKRHETLESTWRTITEGRPMPLTRHLRKSDTWETHGSVGHLQENDQRMIKSDTFNDRTTTTSSLKPSPGLGKLRREPSGKLRKEASPSQDELNRRVEAFIKKFNEDMRLQRQESLNQYMEMINRGGH